MKKKSGTPSGAEKKKKRLISRFLVKGKAFASHSVSTGRRRGGREKLVRKERTDELFNKFGRKKTYSRRLGGKLLRRRPTARKTCRKGERRPQDFAKYVKRREGRAICRPRLSRIQRANLFRPARFFGGKRGP